MEEPRPDPALYSTSEPPSPEFSRSPRQAAQRVVAKTDSDSGGNGRQGGTSEAGLFSNKRGDQTCSLPVKENIIVENGRTGWCGRVRACFVPIWPSSVSALIWFQGSLPEIENKCAAFWCATTRASFFAAFPFAVSFCVASFLATFLIRAEATKRTSSTCKGLCLGRPFKTNGKRYFPPSWDSQIGSAWFVELQSDFNADVRHHGRPDR